jgi:hypothetical protein
MAIGRMARSAALLQISSLPSYSGAPQRLIVLCMHIGAARKQHLHRLRIAITGRVAQRPIVHCMHIGAASEQHLHRLRMVPFGRHAQRPIVFGMHIGSCHKQIPHRFRSAFTGLDDEMAIQKYLLIR